MFGLMNRENTGSICPAKEVRFLKSDDMSETRGGMMIASPYSMLENKIIKIRNVESEGGIFLFSK